MVCSLNLLILLFAKNLGFLLLEILFLVRGEPAREVCSGKSYRLSDWKMEENANNGNI